MPYWISFEPLLPLGLLILLGAGSGLIVLALLFLRRRGGVLRAICWGLFILVLANPLLLSEEREPLKAVVALVADRSPSQNFARRSEDTDAALALLQQSLVDDARFDVRIIETGGSQDGKDRDATHLVPALQQALADVPPSRRAGLIVITDGQLHDTPAALAQLDIQAPINALITGESQEYDRRLQFVEAPSFGLVGKEVALSFVVWDEGQADENDTVLVEITINGTEKHELNVKLGEKSTFSFKIPLAGLNVIEARVAEEPDELTGRNNHKAVMIDGVRENLNVLLVSGEPHPGVRLWRDLLKSDTGVDLIHFTILRPPEKFDNTPVNELSLIAFPTTELFVDKIDEFDLVILDRYQHYDVLPLIYYDYIAQYVKNGGALLMATGPEYAGGASLALTPLISILPALPTGLVIEQPFLPQLTKAGEKHPVTNALSGKANKEDAPEWGHWLRQIEVDMMDDEAQILLQGAQDKPLLLLAHKGEGRVGMLLSDQAWLWARGFEGGGPYATLYRRAVHWLMKQPDLEEEALFATVQDHDITIRRQTMSEGGESKETRTEKGANDENGDEEIEPVHLTLPSGERMEATLKPDGSGRYSTTIRSPESGFVRLEHGDLTRLVLVGGMAPLEFDEVISTTKKLENLVQATGGHMMRLRANSDASSISLPVIESVADGNSVAGDDKIILRQSSDSRILDSRRIPLYPAILALLLTLTLLAATWYRESR